MGWIGAGGASLIFLASVIYSYKFYGAKGRRGALFPKDQSTKHADKRSPAKPALQGQGDISGVQLQLKMPLDPTRTPTAIILQERDGQIQHRVPDIQEASKPPSVQEPATPTPSSQPPMPEPPRLKSPSFSSMPPPPRPNNGTVLRPTPSAASMLRVPPTKVLSNASMAPSSSTRPVPSSKPSRKVVLAPGHSPLDWAMLTSNPQNKLRGKGIPDHLIRVTPSQLNHHNGRRGKDAWTEFQGKVYNITPYLPYHPGGEGELLRGAGRNAAKLFQEVHPWVNWDGILGECLVGILVGESEDGRAGEVDTETAPASVNTLDEMD